MSDDILELATRALREETAGADESTRFTRGRILASVHKHERRRRSYIAFLLPIAAVLVGSTALAASGNHVDWPSVARVMGFAPPKAAPKPAPPAATPKVARLGPPRVVVPKPEPEAEAAPPPPLAPLAPPEPLAFAGSNKAKPASVRVADPEIARYKKAHQLHFEGGAPALALAGWDGYLKQSPSGRFAAEASYNRAITLARMGRTAEAKSALEPFANGSYGSYRKESASALLQALASR